MASEQEDERDRYVAFIDRSEYELTLVAELEMRESKSWLEQASGRMNPPSAIYLAWALLFLLVALAGRPRNWKSSW